VIFGDVIFEDVLEFFGFEFLAQSAEHKAEIGATVPELQSLGGPSRQSLTGRRQCHRNQRTDDSTFLSAELSAIEFWIRHHATKHVTYF